MTTPSITAPELTDEDKERMRLQLEAATAGAKGSEKERELEEAIQRRDSAVLHDALGRDLDFDPKAFITQGVIIKKGIPINDKTFVDMKSLTTKERMLAEAMVRDRFGNMKMDSVYLTAIEAAMMAVSITRINKQPFENPDVAKPMADELNKKFYEGKNQLFDMFLDSSNELVTLLSVLYKNLEAVTVPTEEIQKKS